MSSFEFLPPSCLHLLPTVRPPLFACMQCQGTTAPNIHAGTGALLRVTECWAEAHGMLWRNAHWLRTAERPHPHPHQPLLNPSPPRPSAPVTFNTTPPPHYDTWQEFLQDFSWTQAGLAEVVAARNRRLRESEAASSSTRAQKVRCKCASARLGVLQPCLPACATGTPSSEGVAPAIAAARGPASRYQACPAASLASVMPPHTHTLTAAPPCRPPSPPHTHKKHVAHTCPHPQTKTT
jgi:hypothetical protein